ncbi:MAG: WG repeat-containing protein [Flavobacteriales bacterium]|nr:WG repeat-containing protein [Flavobacteriales bacterium]
MKVFILTMLVPALAFSQNTWHSFMNEDELVGFKDEQGEVRIPPKYVAGFTHTNRFEHIAAVLEQIKGTWGSDKYLLKSGKTFGTDSVYFWDNTADCEKEGFIRFRDRKTDKVGFFNRQGKVSIAAEYSDARPFTNGLAIVIKDAKKACWGNQEYDPKNPCEHWSWKDGVTMLIDTNNNVLLEDYPRDSLHLFKTFQWENESSDLSNPNRDYFKSPRGATFSLINAKREFRNWYQGSFLMHPISPNHYDLEIAYWSKSNEQWEQMTKEDLLKNYSKYIQRICNSREKQTSIFNEHLNHYIFESSRFNEYYDNCGDHKSMEFPVFEIGIRNPESLGYQSFIQFLRTTNGYKVISMNLDLE